MMVKRILWSSAALLMVAIDCGVAQPLAAPVEKERPFVSPIFGDNMVMQRGKPNTIWGWSQPGDTIRIDIAGRSFSAIAGADQRWQVQIAPPPVGGPYTLVIRGRHTAELHNVLVGDVWLCGGQSNMEFTLRQAKNGDEEVQAANFPDIRFFKVEGGSAYRPVDVPQGSWKTVSPSTADRLSAVAYYFARRVQRDISVPIGLVVDAVGGTPAESWTSAGTLRALKDFDVPLGELARWRDAGAPEYGNFVAHWYDEYDVGMKANWASPDSDTSGWKSVTVPGGFAELGVPATPAVAWFRKEIVLPDPLPTGRAVLSLGVIERMDTVYLNGTWIGASAWVENPRTYPVAPGILKPGRNVVVVRVLKTKAQGGFLSKPEELRLVLGDQTGIPLAGVWQVKLSVDARPPHPMPLSYENWPVMPSVLYNGMLAPIAPLAITGALWYQGEQNSDRGFEYRKILPAMIADWRSLFVQGDFPFYIVSLPAFKHHRDLPGDDEWAETRESQALTAAHIPNSCLAVTIDTGDPDNIHPTDKIPVGDRLARCALANYYHENIAFSGPTLSSADLIDHLVRLHFTHTEGGLVAAGGRLKEFQIAGADKRWIWADATIVGDTIEVSSPKIPEPVAVRYAWQAHPAATLFNGAGLPATPFRTDTWPGMTDARRPY